MGTQPVVTDPVVTPPPASADKDPKDAGTPLAAADAASTKDDGTQGGTKEGDEQDPQQPDWCWWPITWLPPVPSTGSGNGASIANLQQTPIGSLLKIPTMQLPQLQIPQLQLPQVELPLVPPELMTQLTQTAQPFIDAVNGLATAASELPFATLTLPVITLPASTPGAGSGGSGRGGGAAIGSGGANPGVAPRPGMPESPRITGKPGGKPASPPEPADTSKNQPAFPAGAGAAPAPSYRAGYTDYLRAAGLGEVAAVAVPGVTGILALVGAGGLLGYRQARAGHTVRASGTGRFMS